MGLLFFAGRRAGAIASPQCFVAVEMFLVPSSLGSANPFHLLAMRGAETVGQAHVFVSGFDIPIPVDLRSSAWARIVDH